MRCWTGSHTLFCWKFSLQPMHAQEWDCGCLEYVWVHVWNVREWSTIEHSGIFQACIQPYSGHRRCSAPVRAWAVPTANFRRMYFNSIPLSIKPIPFSCEQDGNEVRRPFSEKKSFTYDQNRKTRCRQRWGPAGSPYPQRIPEVQHSM